MSNDDYLCGMTQVLRVTWCKATTHNKTNWSELNIQIYNKRTLK